MEALEQLDSMALLGLLVLMVQQVPLALMEVLVQQV
jgi:hypothetical protein